jgi:hypothetical protein
MRPCARDVKLDGQNIHHLLCHVNLASRSFSKDEGSILVRLSRLDGYECFVFSLLMLDLETCFLKWDLDSYSVLRATFAFHYRA